MMSMEVLDSKSIDELIIDTEDMKLVSLDTITELKIHRSLINLNHSLMQLKTESLQQVARTIVEYLMKLIPSDGFVISAMLLGSSKTGLIEVAESTINTDIIHTFRMDSMSYIREFYHKGSNEEYIHNKTHTFPIHYNGSLVAVIHTLNMQNVTFGMKFCSALAKDLFISKMICDQLSSATRSKDAMLLTIQRYNMGNIEGLLMQGCEVLNAQTITLYKVNEERKNLNCVFSPFIKSNVVDFGIGVAGHVAVFRTLMNIENVNTDPRLQGTCALYHEIKPTSVLASPIFNKAGILIGIVEAVNCQYYEGKFNKFCQDFAVQFCGLLSHLLDGDVDFGSPSVQLNKKDPSLPELSSISKYSIGQENAIRRGRMCRILPSLIAEASHLLKSSICNIYIITEQNLLLTIRDVPHDTTSYGIILFPINRGIAGRVAATKETIRLQNAGTADPSLDLIVDGPHYTRCSSVLIKSVTSISSLLCTPIFNSTGNLIGVIEVCNKINLSDGYSDHDQALLLKYAEVCGAALENVNIHLSLFSLPEDREKTSSAFGILIDKFGYLKEYSKPLESLLCCHLSTMFSNKFNVWLNEDINRQLCDNINAGLLERIPTVVPDYYLKRKGVEDSVRISYTVVTKIAPMSETGEVLIIFEYFGKVCIPDESKIDEYKKRVDVLQTELKHLYDEENVVSNFELPVTRTINILGKLLKKYKRDPESAQDLVTCISTLVSPDAFVSKIETPLSATDETSKWLVQEFTNASRNNRSPKKKNGAPVSSNKYSNRSENDGTEQKQHRVESESVIEYGVDDSVNDKEVPVASDTSTPLPLLDKRTRSASLTPMTVAKRASIRNESRRITGDTSIHSNSAQGFKSLFLYDWDINMFDISSTDLFLLISGTFRDFDLFNFFGISDPVFSYWYESVQSKYRDNLFHNFLHGANVAHKSFLIFRNVDVLKHLDRLDLFVILVAALCHDIDHPGVNNNYIMKSKDNLALLYNDYSVLENHHASMTFKIMNNPEANIMSSLSPMNYIDARRSIINAILSTDMAGHFDTVSKFRAVFTASSESGMNNVDTELVINVIVHAADLSNPVLTWSLSKKWSDLVGEEFTAQANLEKTNGFEVTEMFSLTKESDIVDRELGFLDFVVLPMWKAMGEVFVSLKERVDVCEANKMEWKKIKASTVEH